MGMDYKQAEAYVVQAEEIGKVLSANQELFDKEKLYEFQRTTAALAQDIQTVRQQSRKLSIGIVGAIKAGKSSFLNACLFDGKPLLPKAATPMTAALTKISYAPSPEARVHFYNQEDWEKIHAVAKDYDAALQSAYEEFCRQQGLLAQGHPESGMYSMPYMTLEEYERQLFRCSSEIQRGAKELVRMAAENPSIEEKLGQVDMLHGDIMGALNDYVGANGTYTPIVSYVELLSARPDLEDMEIVDTPGLNDPIVSRGIVTKQFLRSCDVVLLLSPCSQFMDSGTIAMMANSLPRAGVREVIVIGSKLDSGILNESCPDFPTAYKNAVNSYKTQFYQTIARVRDTGRQNDLIDKLSQGKGAPLFVSSTCYTIARKQKTGEALDKAEQLVLQNLKHFTGFEEQFLASIGGIGKVRAALDGVLKRKAEIIEGKNATLLDTARRNHLWALDGILQEIVSSRTKLETVSADELKKKIGNIRDVIDSARDKLRYIFENATTSCDAKIQQIRPQLTIEMQHHQDFQVEVKTHEEREPGRAGFLGLCRVEIRFTVTEYGVATSDVVSNIQQYASKCQIYVNEEFRHIFNKEQFAQQVKEVVLAAFQKSGQSFEEDDILLPLKNVLDRISIPHMQMDYTPYIDELESRFPSGYVKNEQIHQLKNLQTRLLNDMEYAIIQQLEDALVTISKELNDQAVHFADEIEGKLCGELEKLQSQVAEREKYIAGYVQFADTLRKIRAELQSR